MSKPVEIASELYDLLSSHNFDIDITDERGQSADPEQGKVFRFDYESPSGRNYGTAVIVIGDDNELMLFYGDNLGRGMDDKDKDSWFEFMKQLKDFSIRHNFFTFSPKNINALKHTMTGMAAIKEGLFEGYYGTRKISYMGEATDARLVIKHSRMIGENDRRYRYVESLFIETAEQERFKLAFKNLAGGRAMLEHVRQGGRPYDIRGQHITETVSEMAVLSRFRRAQQGRMFEAHTQQIVEQANHYYENLKTNLHTMSSSRGYRQYFESWTPATIGEQEALVENLRNMFVEQTLDTRIEQALPTLAKISQGTVMKEVDIFESWMDRIAEGTWALPDTPEAQAKLNELMSKELIVGPDATNATEQLYDVIGDDELFDILSDLAQKDPRANIWDDTDVQARMAELGIQLNTTADADQQQPVAPAAGQQAPGTEPEQDVKEEMTDGERAAQKIQVPAVMRKKSGDPNWKVTGQDIETSRERTHSSPEGLAALQQRLGMKEADELRRMMELAQVPVKESVLTDSTGDTLQHILNRFKHEVKQFEQGADLDTDLYHTLYDYYSDAGEIPYGVAKGRTGDPFEWVTDRLDRELGTGNYAPRMTEADPMDTFEVMSGFDAPVAEGSCNMTAEGEYCPEHGLAECGYMESMGGTVAGSVAPAMDAMDEAMFPGSKIGDKLRSMKQGIGQHADSIKLGLASMPGAAAGASAGAAMGAANLGSAGGSAAALFAPALGTGLLAGAAGALGGFLTYKGLNWLAQKLFGTTEEALEFAKAHLRAAGAGRPSFEFQGKTYPVKIKNEQEINQLLDKIKTLQMHTTEATEDPINRNDAITGSYYESRESDALLARIKSLALLK